MSISYSNASNNLPDHLSHYYEASIGPFINLSDLPPDVAEAHLDSIRQAGQTFASQRSADYLNIRRQLEEQVRSLFIQKGGMPMRWSPQYMILGACSWALSWYLDGQDLQIPLDQFPSKIISFTYGDTFPAMRFDDGKPYRGQVYRLDKIIKIRRLASHVKADTFHHQIQLCRPSDQLHRVSRVGAEFGRELDHGAGRRYQQTKHESRVRRIGFYLLNLFLVVERNQRTVLIEFDQSLDPFNRVRIDNPVPDKILTFFRRKVSHQVENEIEFLP